MPDSPAKQTARIARRRRLAEALVQGQQIKQFAAVEQVSTRTVLRDLKDPETTELLSRLVGNHGAELERLFARSLAAIDKALDSTTLIATGRGKTRKVEDHRSRLWAVQQLARLLQVCATRAETGSQQQGWSWTNLKQVWMEAQRG